MNNDINWNGDSYYMYKDPLILSKASKLIKVTSEEDFKQYEFRRIILDVLSVIGILLVVVIIGMFC